LAFVVLVQADQGGLDFVVAEQIAGAPGVLGGDHGHVPQDPQCAKGDVLEVANGRADHVERAGRDGPITLRPSTGRGVHARILLYDWELGHCRMSRLARMFLMTHARR
jgi:hypothetical protein